MLDPRLSLCADSVIGNFVCDIGTDHAYLPCELIASGRCFGAIAADVNPKPLEFAAATAEKYGLSQKIKLVLSDGLKDIDTAGVTDIVIAGMGGELISRILAEGAACGKLTSLMNLVLQPMTKAAHLRRFLCKNGFEILSENAAYDYRFTYTVIRAVYSGRNSVCDAVHAEAGFMDFSDENAARYARMTAERLAHTAEGLRKAGKTEEADSYALLSEKIIKLIGEDSEYGNCRGYF